MSADWKARLDKLADLESRSTLTCYERGQLAALLKHPCTPPSGLTDEQEDEWCSGWSDYGEED